MKWLVKRLVTRSSLKLDKSGTSIIIDYKSEKNHSDVFSKVDQSDKFVYPKLYKVDQKGNVITYLV